MTINNLWTDGERLLAVTDSAVFAPRTFQRAGNATKLCVLPLVPGVLLGRGLAILPWSLGMGLSHVDDAEILAATVPDTLTLITKQMAASPSLVGAPLDDVELLFGGWSRRHRRIAVHRFTRAAGGEFIATEAPVPGTHIAPADASMVPPVSPDDLGNVAKMVELARWQHNEMRKRDGRYQSGGQLIAAQVTSRGVMLEQVGDLG